LPRRGYPPTQTWRTFLRNQAFAIGTITFGEAGRPSDELLALVRRWIARLVRCVTKVRIASFAGSSRPSSSTLHSLRPYRSSNRTEWRDLPTTLGGDIWTMACRRLSPYRSRVSPRRKLPAFTDFARPSLSHARAKPPTISYKAICIARLPHERPAQKTNDPQCPPLPGAPSASRGLRTRLR
jgi:hypothetical protein